MNEKKLLGVVIIVAMIFAITTLWLYIQNTSLSEQVSYLENKRPVWCDDYNTCYVLEKFVDYRTTGPFTLVISKGFRVESVEIVDIKEGGA